MAKKKLKRTPRNDSRKTPTTNSTSGNSSSSKLQNRFHLEFLNEAQKDAWSSFDKHDVLFLLGPAGCGKSHLACAFAINEILAKKKDKIVLTRPIIEAGEALGFLPGTMDEKVHPYMLPMYDCISRTVGKEGPQRELVDRSLELAPLAYMRGRSLLNSEILVTPNGSKLMGEIKVGDNVIGINGKPVKVVGVYPQGKIPYVKLSFSDGTKSFCSWDHLWATWTNEDRLGKRSYSIKSTKEIADSLFDGSGSLNHEIPLLNQPVQFEQQPVLMDPYTLGVLISSCANFYNPKLGPIKHAVIEKCLSGSDELSFTCLKNQEYKLFLGDVEKYLDEADLAATGLNDRFIPASYKINSIDCRLSILQGIMDACGQIGNEFMVCLDSEALALDILFIVRSLGGYGKKESILSNRGAEQTVQHRICFSLDFNPFTIKSKTKQAKKMPYVTPRKMIVGVEPVGEDLCTCISVDDIDHLFATNDFILTHNTFNDAVCIFDEAQNATKTQLKLFLTRFGQNSKVIITGDPKQSDLRLSDQSLMNVVQSLEDLPGIGVIYFDAESIVRHPLIASIIERLEDKK
jgi:phosphate starvation-inducible PhoH-like protein